MENKYLFRMNYVPRAEELAAVPNNVFAALEYGSIFEAEQKAEAMQSVLSVTADAAMEAMLAMVARVYVTVSDALPIDPTPFE